MDRSKAVEIFDGLLKSWVFAQNDLISEFCVNKHEGIDKVNKRANEIREQFLTALGE